MQIEPIGELKDLRHRKRQQVEHKEVRRQALTPATVVVLEMIALVLSRMYDMRDCFTASIKGCLE